ncbi:hypothetical protein D9C73_018106 [Collichthys lucidus]|uniref:Uncharacterized protein n=1 Tax=Collichthys lucidus TaxID=240159 RepID=A0A4U5VE41_COLLU|nr:hypothetical protein D9C73_018106 [Collichthys lucidus]
MASAPRRRWSKDLPPDLSELMNTLINYAHSFIRKFDYKEPAMRRIVRELQTISDEVREEVQNRGPSDFTRGVRQTFGFLAAPLELVEKGVQHVTNAVIESGAAHQVETLGKEFMEIVEPMKIDLKQIQTTCEKLEQESSKVKATYTLEEMEEFEGILRRVSALGKQSEGVLGVLVTVLGWLGDLVMLVVNVVKATVSREAEEKLRASIMESAERCQKVVRELETMKKELTEFI